MARKVKTKIKKRGKTATPARKKVKRAVVKKSAKKAKARKHVARKAAVTRPAPPPEPTPSYSPPLWWDGMSGPHGPGGGPDE